MPCLGTTNHKIPPRPTLEAVPQCPLTVTPAKAGVQNRLKALVSGFCRKDKKADYCLNIELRHTFLVKGGGGGWCGFFNKSYERGFTLLEIIMTFILAVFVGSMLIEYMGTSLTRGGDAVIMVQDGFSANSVMEKITADYEDEYKNGNYSFSTFKSNIEGGNNSSNTPYYGDYTVAAAYIAFPDGGGTETADTSGNNNLLKVTITVGTQSMTTIFRNKD
jgi:type II secretory pathway pseudopilin PulG